MVISTFARTPTVVVLGNNSQCLRDLTYHRHPERPALTETRITRHFYDARGLLIRSADPRLHAIGSANFRYRHDLNGNLLLTVGVDAGSKATLYDAAGRGIVSVDHFIVGNDCAVTLGQAVTRRWSYEPPNTLGRTDTVSEQAHGSPTRVSQRFVYAGSTDATKAQNLTGTCVSHYDTAGRSTLGSLSLTGTPLRTTRSLLKGIELNDAVADWQGADASTWDTLLDGEVFVTRSEADATGAVITTRDARDHVQTTTYDASGQVSRTWVTFPGHSAQPVIRALAYSASGQTLREDHANGVVTTYSYDAETQRLSGVVTERPVGHALGAKVLRDLRYLYDAVGNVLKMADEAEPIRFWRNQRVAAVNTYQYDSLYQLVRATGRESVSTLPSGSAPHYARHATNNDAAYTNYQRLYDYDAAGNLTQLSHNPAIGSGYTVKLTLSQTSNRGVLSSLADHPSEVDDCFTAGGQQRYLHRGQHLTWTPEGELRKVTPVVRDGAVDDFETYRYDANHQRVVKISVQQIGEAHRTKRVLYLPGLELCTTAHENLETACLHVLLMDQASPAHVRMLRWEHGAPDAFDHPQMRYSYEDLTGSSGLEIDGTGQLVSKEEYYPYGGTAVWTARHAAEADLKTIRFSGKERDATGLYYFGYRYYQPWVGRWLSADPLGTVDGLNLYAMAANNPVTIVDHGGLFNLNVHTRLKKWLRRRRVDKSYRGMMGGSLWTGSIKSENSVKKLSTQNVERLRKLNYPLTQDAYEFVERMKSLDYDLIHYSGAEVAVPDGTLYSKKELQIRKSKFSQRNTTPADIKQVGTDDFVFFSLGVGGYSGKTRSRFGKFKYSISLEKAKAETYLNHAHVTINDTLTFDKRQTSEGRLTGLFKMADVNRLREESVAIHASETLFHISDFKEGLALRTVDTTKTLSSPAQKYVYGSRTNADFDELVSLFWRPQMLVPKKFSTRHMSRQVA